MAPWRFVVTNRSMMRLARGAFRKLMLAAHAGAAEVSAGESVLGELLANAFMHGDPGDIEVLAYSIDESMRLCVTSKGPAFTFFARTPGPTECGGRGFLIMASLASDIDVKREAPYNIVTLSLPLISPSSPPLGPRLAARPSL